METDIDGTVSTIDFADGQTRSLVVDEEVALNIVGLIEGIGGLLFARFPLPGVIAAWLWNIPRLPSALAARFTARRGRAVGDEELFRYQVAGSARLRSLWDETMTRVRQRFPEGILLPTSSELP